MAGRGPRRAGLGEVLRAVYLKGKAATVKFTLEQSDKDVVGLGSGLTPVAVGAVGHKIYVGQEGVIERAIVFVGTNKLDGKELERRRRLVQ